MTSSGDLVHCFTAAAAASPALSASMARKKGVEVVLIAVGLFLVAFFLLWAIMATIERVFGVMHWPGKSAKILRSELRDSGVPAIQSTGERKIRARKLKAKAD